MFYSIHYLFDNIDSIRTLFKNVSNVVGKNGFFLVTTLDGEKVYDNLKNNKFEIEGRLDSLMWSIKGSSELIAENYSRLPSNLEEGFNNKIRVFVESVGQSFDEYLSSSCITYNDS